MKKIISFVLFLILIFNISFPAVTWASEITRPVTHGNNVIEFSVNNKGRFNIRSTELGNPIRPNDSKKTLLFYDGENETSFTTFRIDGEEYIFGENYAYSLSQKAKLIGQTVKEGDSIVTTYKIGSNDNAINIIQRLSVINDTNNTNYGNVYIQYALENNTGREVNIGARILQDLMIGDNDGCAVKIGDNFFDKEIEFTGENVPDIWRATDNEFAPNVVGYGYTNGWGNIKPDKLIIGHWQGLSETSYDYTVNEELNFTVESDYGSKDTAIAYYWEPKSVSNNETINFETYLGLGQIIDKELTYATNILAPTQMVVNEDKTGYVNDGEFEIAVMIENNLPNSEEIYDVMAYLTFDDAGGAVSLNNDAGLKGTKLIKKGGQYTFRWKLKATAGEEYNATKYKVQLYDRRNVYQEGDELPEGKKVGDVKLEEIYTVSKGLVLPSKSGAPPQITFGTISPNEIYYSGKNLVTVNCTGIPLLSNKESWELQYRINKGEYKVVSSDNINVVLETNSLEIMFEEQFDVGEMDFRIKILNDLFTEGTDESKYILKDDIYKIPGTITVSKDKAVMPRTYGMLAIVSDSKDGETIYHHPIPIKDETQLEELNKALEEANKKDGDEFSREVLMVISGDIRSVRDNGQLSKYVVYAQHKKAIINNIITYTSAIPITIQYLPPLVEKNRTSIQYFSGENDGMTDTLKEALTKTTTIPESFELIPGGTSIPGVLSDAEFDFSYVGEAMDHAVKAKQTVDLIKGNILSSDDLILTDVGGISVTGLGILGINSGDGFDFWMDMFSVQFADNNKYALWDIEEGISPVQFNLDGVGAVLNKAMDGLPVQIGGVRVVQDDELDMLTFDATVDLTMLPGNVVVNAEDVFFSTKGYEGIVVNAEAAPEPIGIIKEMNLNVRVDTYNGEFGIVGGAQVQVVKCDIEFKMIKEKRNDTWYLSDCIIAGGGKPGIPIFAGAAYITKLGGGVRNLVELTNPYYDNPEAIFTVVVLMDLNVVKTLDGEFTGEFTKRYLEIGAERAAIKKLDIFRDVGVRLTWITGGPELFRLRAKGTINIEDVLIGEAKLTISDIFFEGSSRLTVKIPGSVPIVGGKNIGRVSFGVSSKKIWGAMGINLLFKTVDIGATYWWRGKLKFDIGQAEQYNNLLAPTPFNNGEDLIKPKGGLYQGTTFDDNGEKVDYLIGTNVEKQENKINNNSLKKIKSVTSFNKYNNVFSPVPVDSDYIGTKTALTITEGNYHHNELSLEDKYVYDVKGYVKSNTKLVFEYEGEEEPNISLYAKTGEQHEEDGKVSDIIGDTPYSLSSVNHVYNDKNYETFIGFDSSEEEVEFVVVSDVELSNYITYTDTISDEIKNEYIYEVTMDTKENTVLAFMHDDELEIDVYKLTGTTFDGKEVIGEKDTSLKHMDTKYNNKNIRIIKGFEAGLSGAKFFVSSNKELTNQNILDASIIDVQDSNSSYGSDIVAEFVSKENIQDAEVFYITDEDDNIIQLPEGDISVLFNEREINNKTYNTMLFPFENNGKYYLYSTVAIDNELSSIYEIERMPKLEKDSVEIKENSLSTQKLDVSWEGSNYRYTADENKKTDRTVFGFYLVDDSKIVNEDDELENDMGVLLGFYNVEEGGPDSYTIDIPKGTPSGNYRIKIILETEGLCHRYAYSKNSIEYINPHSPEKVTNVKASTIGNGLLDVSWENSETVDEYYIEVFDENKELMNSFGSASVEGNIKKAVIGGVYETFNPENPEESTVAGLESGKDYIVGITPVKKIDDTSTIIGETTYSEKIYLPKPNPASINIDFGDENTYTRTETSYGINADGEATTEDIAVKGANKKSPLLTIKTDQNATIKILLDKVELQNTTDLSKKVDLQMDKLTEGVHYLDVIARTENGDVSHESLKFYIDTRGPELLINSPQNNEYISSDMNSVVVSGRTEVGAKIKVNGVTIPVDEKGIYEGNVPVDKENVKTVLLIESSDDFGNITKNKTEVIRNIAPIKDVVISTDIPNSTRTIKKPIYEVTMKKMTNIFTGQEVDVPMTTDEVIGYDEEVISENIVKMGSSYKIDVQGIPENLESVAAASSDDYVGIDKNKVKYEILEGKTLASIDDNGVLKIKNNGDVVVKVSYEVLSDYVGENGEKVKGYSFDKYITMTSEFVDVYPSDPDEEDKDGEDNDGDNNEGDKNTGDTDTGDSGREHPGYNPKEDTNDEVTKEKINITVTDGKENLVSEIDIVRTTEKNGDKKDKVVYKVEQAKATSEKLKEEGKDTARIVLPDKKDKVVEARINIPKGSISTLAKGNISLEIDTENARINIPKESIQSLDKEMKKDLFFKLVPIKKTQGKKEIIKRAKKEEIVKEAIQDTSVSVVGRPMTIETNMDSKAVDIILPLQDVSIPKESKARKEFLKNLAVFIEHSDGEKVVTKGEVVEYKEGELGIKFRITKFSTFTIIKLDKGEFDFINFSTPKTFMQDKEIKVKFNRPIDISTMTKESIYVEDSSGNKVEAVLKYNPIKNEVTVSPVKNYTLGASYKLYVTNKLLSVLGEPISKKITYKFNIGNVSLNMETKMKEYKDVLENKEWVIELDEIIDLISSESNGIKVYDENCNEVEVLSTVVNNKTIKITPKYEYQKGKTYYLIVNGLISESGEELNKSNWIKFTIINK
ncbi:Ig-like domain-containing protein [Oceanirhabdus seepicola]|uniref:Ig-like domain-containing protein n=1 Tax=Oceanirhabdus seepicola TaxID=2828781 RepID=A0A9J6NYF7_9CLOT|nr:Ig-like domain-containing protein [Oceanirhabdus seepicola]MCM1988929.1 Ig-like domain-containing protein [Oceanirhabdus seepicola]